MEYYTEVKIQVLVEKVKNLQFASKPQFAQILKKWWHLWVDKPIKKSASANKFDHALPKMLINDRCRNLTTINRYLNR
jgi:hypothetical protein